MAAIYSDQHRPLKELLAMAGKTESATLLVPDLQRPYVWLPFQVVVLIDSLIRGWPFGTLLTWQVKSEDPARALARTFWKVVDRTGVDDGTSIDMRHPPASFHMVLDGQQRVQSLLLALGGDGWGFKLLDRQWHEQLSGTRPRGPRGRPHWSLGCLCVDVPALCDAYANVKRATSIDYTKVLQWIVTDDAVGQSRLSKPSNYIEPLKKASSSPGHFIRLARLWEEAPEQAGIDPYEAEELAAKILADHGVSEEIRNQQKRPVGALLIALKDVKQTRVTYLELSGYEPAFGARDVYNDAVVNIFTRLNTAGRTLTREDITFSWLKIGWNTDFTQSKSAKLCIEELAQKLGDLSLPLLVEDIISSISFVWSVSFNSGNLLNNDDLMKGEAIRPMAANVSENWCLIEEAVICICRYAKDRGLHFRQHYQSVNALAYLWAWYFAAIYWRAKRQFNELEKDSFDKSLTEILDAQIDRWLICSQWAGVWASASAQSLSGYAVRLASCSSSLTSISDLSVAVAALREQLQSEVKTLEQDAVNGLNSLNADDRQQVRGYYAALWLWNRLELNRWEKAKIALRKQGRQQNLLEVDHIVAFDLWRSKIEARQERNPRGDDVVDQLDIDELMSNVNELGNCMLLEKNFNISKGNRQIKDFLESVHEFKEDKISIKDWAAALDIEMPQVESTDTDIMILKDLFAKRTLKIRNELEQFVRGTKSRIDK